MKVAKILGVVFGALFLLTGIALLAGAAVFGAGQGEFDRQLAEQGLAGPANGTVTAVDGTIFTVDYVDKNGLAQTGAGPVAQGTTPPAQGDDVQVYYSTLDPSQIIILDFPGGNFAGVAGLLRTIAIVCLVIGAVLLVAGILGLVTARRRRRDERGGYRLPGRGAALRPGTRTRPSARGRAGPDLSRLARAGHRPHADPALRPGPAGPPGPADPAGPADRGAGPGVQPPRRLSHPCCTSFPETGHSQQVPGPGDWSSVTGFAPDVGESPPWI